MIFGIIIVIVGVLAAIAGGCWWVSSNQNDGHALTILGLIVAIVGGLVILASDEAKEREAPTTEAYVIEWLDNTEDVGILYFDDHEYLIYRGCMIHSESCPCLDDRD